MKVQVSE